MTKPTFSRNSLAVDRPAGAPSCALPSLAPRRLRPTSRCPLTRGTITRSCPPLSLVDGPTTDLRCSTSSTGKRSPTGWRPRRRIGWTSGPTSRSSRSSCVPRSTRFPWSPGASSRPPSSGTPPSWVRRGGYPRWPPGACWRSPSNAAGYGSRRCPTVSAPPRHRSSGCEPSSETHSRGSVVADDGTRTARPNSTEPLATPWWRSPRCFHTPVSPLIELLHDVLSGAFTPARLDDAAAWNAGGGRVVLHRGMPEYLYGAQPSSAGKYACPSTVFGRRDLGILNMADAVRLRTVAMGCRGSPYGPSERPTILLAVKDPSDQEMHGTEGPRGPRRPPRGQ